MVKLTLVLLMQFNTLIILFLSVNSVSASLFTAWFFKSSAPVAEPSDAAVDEKRVVILTEMVDSEKQQFLEEHAIQLVREKEAESERRLEYLAALPKSHDSMEKISEEVSLGNLWKKRFDFVANKLAQLEFHSDQYSFESESDELSSESTMKNLLNSSPPNPNYNQ